MFPNPLAGFVFLCGVMSAVIALYAWRHRVIRGSQMFSAFMFSIAIYALGYSMELTSLDLPGMLFWSKIGYLGIFSFPTLFLLFVLQYTRQDRWLTGRYILLLFLIPTLLLIAKFTDDVFHLVYSSVWVDTSGKFLLLGFTRGPVYLFALYSIIPVGLGVILLWQKRQNTLPFYQKQANLIMASTIFPLLVFITYMSGLQPFPNLKHLDVNVFIYTLWGIGLGWAVFRYRLLELAPIAREVLIERLSDGVFVIDDKVRLVDANPVALKILGLTQPPIGQAVEQVFSTWKDLREAIQTIGNVDPVQIGIQQVIGDKRFFFDLNITALQAEMGRIIGHLIVLHDITELKRAEEALLKLTAFEERQRLGRDLHDSVNQSIHELVLLSETLVVTLDKNNPDRARQIAERLQESGRQALKETRLLLYEIQPTDMERGVNLIHDLETRLLTVERHTGVRAQIIQEGSMDYCPQAWQENLFWITIEALNNAMKHAQAHNIQIIIRCFVQHLDLEVVDDGKGFDPGKPHIGGLGLRSMRERAKLLGGELTILSKPGEGSRICFSAEIKASRTHHE